jgi:hypothetical protein
LNQQQQQQQQQMQPTEPKNMLLIDSINESENCLPNEIFSDSIINQQHDSFQNNNNKLKNWNSESNLIKRYSILLVTINPYFCCGYLYKNEMKRG